MPSGRCGCQDACSCLVIAGQGITVEGIGTLERPYEVAAVDLDDRLIFSDAGNVNFEVNGSGGTGDPMIVYADAVLSMNDLTDVPDGNPENGQVPVWVGDHWEYQDQAGADIVAGASYASSRHNISALSFVTGGQMNYVPFPTVVAEENITWSNDSYLIPVSGWYQVNAGLTWSANITGNRWIGIRVNGSTSAGNAFQGAASTGKAGVQISRKIKLNAGDLVGISATQDSGATLTLSATVGDCYFDISLTNGAGPLPAGPSLASARYSMPVVVATQDLTPLPFTVSKFNDGIMWDQPVAGGFNITEAGCYQVSAGVPWVASGQGYRQIGIYVNGIVWYADMVPGHASLVVWTSISGVVKCAVNDLVSIRVLHTHPGDLSTANISQLLPYVSIARV